VYVCVPVEVGSFDEDVHGVKNAASACSVRKNDVFAGETTRNVLKDQSYSDGLPLRSNQSAVNTCDELSACAPYPTKIKTFESAPTTTTRTVTTTETITTTTVTVKSSNTTSTLTAPHTPPPTDICTSLSTSKGGNQGSEVSSYRPHPDIPATRGGSDISVQSSTDLTECSDMTTRRGSRPILYPGYLSDDGPDLHGPITLALSADSATATAIHPSTRCLYSRSLDHDNLSSQQLNPSTSGYPGNSGRPYPASDRSVGASESSFDTTAGQLGVDALSSRTQEANKKVFSASLPYMLGTQSSRQRDNSKNFSNSTPCLAPFGAVPSSSRGMFVQC
jgi:hypothetical protein